MTNDAGLAVARAIDEARLWQRHVEMAKIGATPKGGVNRQALTPEEGEARKVLARWADELGCSVHVDPIGNMFLRREGADPDAAPVVTGSHIDTQPTGGRFDGAFGVLAGVEVLHALNDAGIITRRPVEVAAWTNEEGSRFQPGCTGSGVFVGSKRLEDMLAVEDRAGVRFADALAQTVAATPNAAQRPLGTPVHAYLESHIEQGPRLEQEHRTIGVVTGIQGASRYEIDIVGEEAHAGTTPHATRKDAFVSAVAIVRGLHELMADPDDVVRFTIGRFETHPGSPNVVPGRVHFSIDFRHPDETVLKARGKGIHEVAAANAGPCEVTVTDITYSSPVAFREAMVQRVSDAADALDLPAMHMPSGAGHDAGLLHAVCPVAMVFVPCERGISHNEIENAAPGDLAAGARVLAKVMADLAQE
ncbi:MAG: M20 family metallo-hydrolase [Alphaproteobacteria bacterium]